MRTILTLGLIGFCGACFGGDDDVVEEPQIPAGRAAFIRGPDGKRREVVIVQGRALEMEALPGDPGRKVVALSSFDFLLNNRESVDAWQARWEGFLETRIRLNARIYRLSAADVRKLQVAGRGDIKRMLDRIESARREFDALRTDVDGASRFLAETVKPMRIQFRAGPFGTDSFYAKLLRRMITVNSSFVGEHGGASNSRTADGGDESD